jgi:hypothetical protein
VCATANVNGGNYAFTIHSGVGQYAAITLQANNTTQGTNDAYIYEYFDSYKLVIGVRNPNANICFETNGGGVRAANISNAGQLQVFTSKLTNTVTSVFTGVASFLTANTSRTSTASVSNEANLAVTLNEIGTYRLECLIMANATANGVGGLQFDFAGGTSNVAWFRTSYLGSVNGAVAGSSTHTTSSSAFSITALSVASIIDQMVVNGLVTIDSPGTFIFRYAQNSSAANATNLIANSYMILTKVG